MQPTTHIGLLEMHKPWQNCLFKTWNNNNEFCACLDKKLAVEAWNKTITVIFETFLRSLFRLLQINYVKRSSFEFLTINFIAILILVEKLPCKYLEGIRNIWAGMNRVTKFFLLTIKDNLNELHSATESN
jgi:hypothetical protein